MKRTVEVPQFLKHSVKIHGLTGRQFLIGLIGAGVSASCWQSLEAASRYLAIGCVAAVVIVSLLIAFVRMGGRPLEEWIVVVAAWAIQPERLRGKAFQRVFQRVKAVGEDGVVEIERGGGYVAIIQVEGVFAEQLEQGGFFGEALTEVLSGLSFPISVQVRMRRIQVGRDIVPSPDLPSTLRRLQAHYLSFLHEQVQARPSREVICSVIVSGGKHAQCVEYTKYMLSGLNRAQLSCRLLSSEEEVKSFYRQTFGGEKRETIAARLKAREVCFETQSERTYGAGLVVSALPGALATDWLASFIQQEEEPYDMRLCIQPVDEHQMAAQLERKAAQFGGALLVANKQGGKGNMITRHALEEVEQLRGQLLLKKSHLFATTMLLCVSAHTRAQMRSRMKQIGQRLRGLNIKVTPLHFQHHLAFLTGISGNNFLSAYAHLLPTEAVAYPFVQIPHLHEQGVLLGATRPGGDLVSFDLDHRLNSNLAVLGVPGAGKSYFLKVLSSRLAFQQRVSLFVIDIEGEYSQWAQAVGAQQTRFSADSLAINPLSLQHVRSLREKLGSFVGLLALLVGVQGALSPHEKALVVEAAMQAYASHGITDDPATYKREGPVMADFMRSLRNLEPTSDLAYRLEMYLHLFPQEAHESEEHEAVEHQVYNLHDLPEPLRAAGMYLIIERLSALLLQDGLKKPHLLLIDEAWFLSRFETGAQFLNEFARRARKYRVGLWVGTQQVNDLIAAGQGEQFKGLLDLCETKLLFRQEVDDLGRLLRLSQSEETFLRGAGRGAALYVTSKERYMIDVLASGREEEFARGANL